MGGRLRPWRPTELVALSSRAVALPQSIVVLLMVLEIDKTSGETMGSPHHRGSHILFVLRSSHEKLATKS